MFNNSIVRDLRRQGIPQPAYTPGPHFSPPEPSAPLPVMLQEVRSPAPHSPALTGHGPHWAGPTHGSASQPGLSSSPPPWPCPTILGPCQPWPDVLAGPWIQLLTLILSYHLGPWLAWAMMSGSAPLPCSAVGLNPGFNTLPSWHRDSWAPRSPSLLWLFLDSHVLSLAQAVQQNPENLLLGSSYF